MLQNPFHGFFSLATSSFINPENSEDWLEWRYVYNGGRDFRREYLKTFSDREDSTEFERRLELTPIPTYAKKEVNRIRNSIAARLPDIIRRDGSKSWREAISGRNKGVDRHGKSMNAFIAKVILPEMLPMQKVGILIDAPRVRGESAADVPRNFRPWLAAYSVEHFRALPAPVESPSDYLAVALRVARNIYDSASATSRTVTEIHRYWLDDSGEVVFQKEVEHEMGPIHRLGLEAIPFVIADAQESLVQDAASYQIAALNMISADSNYAVDSNFAFLVRQRGKNTASHLIGDDDEAQVGRGKGLFYEQDLNEPKFISPPSEPIQASLEIRKEMKKEVREIITGNLIDLGDDGSEEAGLAFLGECVRVAEERIWDHWIAYESKDSTRRRTPTISYPETWSLKTDAERMEEANAFIDLANKLVGQTAKKEANKEALDRLWKGRKTNQDIDRLKTEIDDAPYSTSDSNIILKAAKEGLVGPKTGALALGFNDDEHLAAEEAAQKRAARARINTADAMNNTANPDNLTDRNAMRDARNVQEGDSDGPGRRGEGEFTTDSVN